MFLKIADFTIALFTDDPELKFGLEGETKNFIINERDPDLRVKARWGDLSKENRGRMIFDSGSLWKLYLENGYYNFHFTSPILGPHPYKIAIFNQEFNIGEVYLHHPYFNRDQSVYPLEYPLDELMINILLAHGKGVEVHACGVVDPLGGGHLFAGQSGTGKTTMARLWQDVPGAAILSDDRIIVRKIDKKLWIYGTPWHGEARLAFPDRAPLKKAYFLEKGQKQELISQNPTNSVGRLFTCSFPPFYNREALHFTLGFLESVAKSVPCYELKFVPNKSVVEFILKNG